MKNTKQCSGFSAIELIIALASTSILLVVAGVLLGFTLTYWGRSSKDAIMRGDADAAMVMIAHRIHTAAYTNISVTSSSLVVSAATFQLSGKSLNFTPTSGGRTLVLISNAVTAFAPALSNSLVTVHLCVTNGINKMDLYGEYFCRN